MLINRALSKLKPRSYFIRDSDEDHIQKRVDDAIAKSKRSEVSRVEPDYSAEIRPYIEEMQAELKSKSDLLTATAKNLIDNVEAKIAGFKSVDHSATIKTIQKDVIKIQGELQKEPVALAELKKILGKINKDIADLQTELGALKPALGKAGKETLSVQDKKALAGLAKLNDTDIPLINKRLNIMEKIQKDVAELKTRADHHAAIEAIKGEVAAIRVDLKNNTKGPDTTSLDKLKRQLDQINDIMNGSGTAKKPKAVGDLQTKFNDLNPVPTKGGEAKLSSKNQAKLDKATGLYDKLSEKLENIAKITGVKTGERMSAKGKTLLERIETMETNAGEHASLRDKVDKINAIIEKWVDTSKIVADNKKHIGNLEERLQAIESVPRSNHTRKRLVPTDDDEDTEPTTKAKPIDYKKAKKEADEKAAKEADEKAAKDAAEKAKAADAAVEKAAKPAAKKAAKTAAKKAKEAEKVAADAADPATAAAVKKAAKKTEEKAPKRAKKVDADAIKAKNAAAAAAIKKPILSEQEKKDAKNKKRREERAAEKAEAKAKSNPAKPLFNADDDPGGLKHDLITAAMLEGTRASAPFVTDVAEADANQEIFVLGGGIHALLHEAILCLNMQAYDKHSDLDEIAKDLTG